MKAWHARYRWAALRLAPFVPPRPRPPKFENALAAMAGLAVAASAVGADDPRGAGLLPPGGDVTVVCVSTDGCFLDMVRDHHDFCAFVQLHGGDV